MKSTIFNIDTKSSCYLEKEISTNQFLWEFSIPLLPAFSIEYFVIQVGGATSYQSTNDKLINNKIIIESEYSLDQSDDVQIIIHYHGIRNYELLFPWITDSDLQKRIGEFYREAELNFDNGAWLSFALMSGAVFEGMLYGKINKNLNFSKLIDEANNLKLINSDTVRIMHMVRDYRNIVHSNKFAKAYISRTEAMDIRTIIDKVIKQF